MRTGLLTAAVVAVVVAVSGLLLAGGSGSSSPSSSKGSGTAAKANTVDIKDFKYEPQTVEIKAGTKISFTNEDTAKHTATSKPQGTFDSGDLTKGQTKAVTLKKAGTFNYFCVYHPTMAGKVSVK